MMLSQNALLTEAVEIQMKHEILKKQHRLPRVNRLRLAVCVYSRVLNISVDALIELQVKTPGVTCLFDT